MSHPPRHARSLRGAGRFCGNDDLRTQQSSVRAAGRYAGGGGAVRIVRAEPASLLTVVPSIISHSSSRICIAQSAASTQSLSLVKGFDIGPEHPIPGPRLLKPAPSPRQPPATRRQPVSQPGGFEGGAQSPCPGHGFLQPSAQRLRGAAHPHRAPPATRPATLNASITLRLTAPKLWIFLPSVRPSYPHTRPEYRLL